MKRLNWQKRISTAGKPGYNPVYDHRAVGHIGGKPWVFDLEWRGTAWHLEGRDHRGVLRRRRRYPNLAMAKQRADIFLNKQQKAEAS